MLGVSGLRLTFPAGDAPALAGVTLDVAEGSLLAVVGPSGSGKSTLLRCIAGLEAPDAGRVVIAGDDVTALAPAARGVALVFQSWALFPHLDVAANIGFGLRARGVAAAERAERVAEIARRLEIDSLLARRPGQLSGGERQRVALARGLVGRPRVLLLDEPLSGLDAQLRDRARAELRRIQRATGVTTVVVTHDQTEALTLGDRVAVLDAGALVACDTPRALYDAPPSVAVARFLGRPPMTVLSAAEAAAVGLPGRDGALVGFRPEDVRLGRGAVARVELVEHAGHEVVCQLVCGDVRFPARVAGAGEGDEVRVSVAPERLRWFDAASGRAM